MFGTIFVSLLDAFFLLSSFPSLSPLHQESEDSSQGTRKELPDLAVGREEWHVGFFLVA